MVGSRSARDSTLIDALEESEVEPFEGFLWRIVQDGKDPCLCRNPGGRWDDRTFDVLYTTSEPDGAIAEMYFHLSRGQPVIPSRIRYRLFKLSVTLLELLRLPTLDHLAALELDISSFGQLSYQDKHREYPRTQDIAETAHFLEYDGILVPSARWDCANVVIFCDSMPIGALDVADDHGIINWQTWRSANP